MIPLFSGHSRVSFRTGAATSSLLACATNPPMITSPSEIEPCSMSRSIDHFSIDPTLVNKPLRLPMNAGVGGYPAAAVRIECDAAEASAHVVPTRPSCDNIYLNKQR
jgi:hypothetical protein